MKKEIFAGIILLTLLLSSFALAQDTAPVTTITKIVSVDTAKEWTTNSDGKIYVSETGSLYIYGNSQDADSSITNVQYNRTSPGFSHVFTDADPVDGAFNSPNENWRTRGGVDKDFVEGNHIVCGRASDISSTGEAICQLFCIDTQKPTIPGKPVHEDDNSNKSDGIGPSTGFDDDTGLTFSWTASDSTGCANIDHYEVEVHFSNGTLWKTVNSDKNRVTIRGADNNEDYFIRVKAVDKAGNPSSFSEDSDEVNVDTENPITGVSNGEDGWKSANFDVHFKDEDAERWGLWFCQYKLSCGDDSDWINRSCSGEEPLTQTIDITNLNIEGTCQVSSKAVDKAGNVGEDSLDVMIDKVPPKIDTIIGEPNYMKGSDLFVTTETPITITATDEASGVKTLCYSINGNEPKCITDEKEFSVTINFLEESEHSLLISAMDNAGNANSIQKIFFVDDTPPITTKTYINFFQETGTWVIEHMPVSIVNFVFDWLSPNSQIILEAQDQQPHPSGVDSTLFKILSLSDSEDSETEWYGNTTRKWYADLDSCEKENPTNDGPEPSSTPSENNIDNAQGGECIQVGGWTTLGDWQKYNNGNIVPGEEGAHKICFKSKDNLGNEEKVQCQVFFVDNIKPTIIPIHPTSEETTIQACTQSIVALVDDKNGIKRAWAELWNSTNDKVREVDMTLGKDKTYDALMDKQLPSGDYMLKIKAEDKIGNIGESEPVTETLVSSVFVEYISPAQCLLNPEQGGQCNFKFSVCMRDANKVSFSLDRLGNIVTPNMMNAEISKGQETAFVGLLDERVESGIINLSDSVINGRTSFNLHLDIPSNVSSQIGAGSHKLNYVIKSFR